MARTFGGPVAARLLAQVQGWPLAGGTTADLAIHQGDVVRITGRNGCGKTSLLRCLAGLDGPFQPRSVHIDAKAGLVFQDARDGLIGLTVAGEARLREQPVPRLLRPNQEVAGLSNGEARRLALHVARGTLWLLDEPSEGLDQTALAELRERIETARLDGAVVMVDHGALANLADRSFDLGGEQGQPRPALPVADGVGRLQAPRCNADHDGASVALPAVDLGPGLYVLRGPNGCGKTTLLRRLAGLSFADGVAWNDAPVVLGSTARLSPAQARGLFLHETVRAELAGAEVRNCAALVPESLFDRHPLTLSGGEAQRVALAKTLGRQAPVYLLDEPEAHLDQAGVAALWDLLAHRLRTGACIVVASHDPIWDGHGTVVPWRQA